MTQDIIYNLDCGIEEILSVPNEVSIIENQHSSQDISTDHIHMPNMMSTNSIFSKIIMIMRM